VGWGAVLVLAELHTGRFAAIASATCVWSQDTWKVSAVSNQLSTQLHHMTRRISATDPARHGTMHRRGGLATVCAAKQNAITVAVSRPPAARFQARV